MANIVVGSARIDENGKISGGAAGDQTGKEVSTQAYYMHSKGWLCIRPKSVDVAEKLANAMISACNNNNIGYDQGNRYGVVNEVLAGTKIANISKKTEADCSSLVRACCIEAGFDPGNFRTIDQPKFLDKTGKFNAAVKVTEDTILYNGDILVTPVSGHTVIVVSGRPRPRADQAVSIPGSTAPAPLKVDVARYRDVALTGTYRTTTSLNMRVGAGTNKQIILVLPASATVKCYGYYNKVNLINKWLYITYTKNGKTYNGYASAKYLKKV